jgi:hypothetical protein
MTGLADNGYVIEAIIAHGPLEKDVRRFLVDASTDAEAIAAVRRLMDIAPEDVLTARPMTTSEIREGKLKPGELRALGRG